MTRRSQSATLVMALVSVGLMVGCSASPTGPTLASAQESHDQACTSIKASQEASTRGDGAGVNASLTDAVGFAQAALTEAEDVNAKTPSDAARAVIDRYGWTLDQLDAALNPANGKQIKQVALFRLSQDCGFSLASPSATGAGA